MLLSHDHLINFILCSWININIKVHHCLNSTHQQIPISSSGCTLAQITQKSLHKNGTKKSSSSFTSFPNFDFKKMRKAVDVPLKFERVVSKIFETWELGLQTGHFRETAHCPM
jgi:hypothetical protein